jgi:putative SOS response-associated peptidase YedK
MCFHVQLQTKKPAFEKYYDFDPNVVKDLENQFGFVADKYVPYYRVSGFDHPNVLMVDQHYGLSYKSWGLMPNWANNLQEANVLANQTINARVETVHEKASFKNAVSSGRGVLLLDGYYEHHHSGNGVYPYRFYRADEEQIAVACLYDEWLNPETNIKSSSFSILTTQGNDKAKLVHNNPKNKEARMPLILGNSEHVGQFLQQGDNPSILNSLAKDAQNQVLMAYAVPKITGKGKCANTTEVLKRMHYPELGFFMPSEL